MTRFNGRPLLDDAMDVMLTLMANQPISDGVVPNANRVRAEFPYYGTPFTREEQRDVKPAAAPKTK